MSKKVMIIAYHFPPDAAVGALRPQKFAKYLPEYGWEPHVLTIREKYIEKYDESRLADVPDTKILRTSFWRTPLQLMIDIRDRLRGYRSEVIVTGLPPSNNYGNPFRKAESFSGRLKRYFIALNRFPDDKFWWTIPAIIAGYRMLRRERIRLIYATAPPPTVAIVGYLLSVLTGAKLILDLRDPWVVAKEGQSSQIRWVMVEGWKRRIEQAVISHAHSVICTTDSYRQVLNNHYRDEAPEKIITITNGYDPEDFTPRNNVQNSKYVISYLGEFYADRSPKVFFKALKQILSLGIIPANAIEIRLIGDVKYARGESVEAMVDQYGLGNIVKFSEFLPHRKAIQEMLASDLLLLLAPNWTHQIPAKAFEYAATRRPILVLTDVENTDSGATADFINSLNAGLVVSQEDVSAIAAALKIFYATRQQPSTRWYKGADPSLFERRNLTEQLANCLNAVEQIAPVVRL